MSIPKGSVWQELRFAALDAIPRTAHSHFSRTVTLTQWQQRGFYSVIRVAARQIHVRAFAQELGTALLTDAEQLLDHAAEQRCTFVHELRSTTWMSPAWLTVTVYYWGYFVAMALTRLIGRSVWHLDRAVVRDFTRLSAASGVASPGGGSYDVLCGAYLSGTERELVLAKNPARVHDALWSTIGNYFETALRTVGAGNADPLEERFYTAMIRAGHQLGRQWPSDFRNSVNYRPGFAYTAVRRIRVLVASRLLSPAPSEDARAFVEQIEAAVSALGNSRSILDNPQTVGELLALYVVALDRIALCLLDEVLSRHSLDRRWHSARLAFIRKELA